MPSTKSAFVQFSEEREFRVKFKSYLHAFSIVSKNFWIYNEGMIQQNIGRLLSFNTLNYGKVLYTIHIRIYIRSLISNIFQIKSHEQLAWFIFN